MKLSPTILLAVTLVTAQLSGASEARAAVFHDCGSICRDCGLAGKEGRTHSPTGIYHMTCSDFIPNCVACVVTRLNDGPDIEEVFARLRTGSAPAIRQLVGKLKGQLRVDTSRNLVVFVGTKCDAKAIASVVSIPASNAALLVKSGVPPVTQSLHASAGYE